MKHTRLMLILLVWLMKAVPAGAQKKQVIDGNLEVITLSPHTLIHVSYLQTEKFGKVACNGIIYINNGEAAIMDTPPDTLQARQLLDWFGREYPEVRIKAVVINHFHNDCLGGLAVFHQRGISSYAHELTRTLAARDGATVPEHGFSKALTLDVGGKPVANTYFGPAHTSDNIVTWIPSEQVLFGGCMIKSAGASKGNLADASPEQWSATVRKVRKQYRKARIVVPGHGELGDRRLLDYTIRLFRAPH